MLDNALVQDSKPTEAKEPTTEQAPPLTEETVKKIIQSETDKVRTKYSHELAAAKEQIDELQKEKMSVAERKKYDEEKLKEELSRKGAEINRKEQTLLAIDLLKEKNIPDRLRSFVVGNTEADTRSNVERLAIEFQSAVKEAIESRFKDMGSIPGKAAADPALFKFYTRAQIADMSKKAMDRSTPQSEREALNKEMSAALLEKRIQ